METTMMKYLADAAASKTTVKVFIESGPNQPKTMLQGKIVDFDEDAIVLDKCLIFTDRIISIAPYNM
jgi:hypothetical protein